CSRACSSGWSPCAPGSSSPVPGCCEGHDVKIEAEQVLCRFQLSNFIRHGTQPLYEWIVETARKEGLQGATVLKGFYGLRPDGSILQEHTWSVSQELPVVVEIVDLAAGIEVLLGRIEPSFHQGVITMEREKVLLYSAGVEPAQPALAGSKHLMTTAD